MFMFKMGDTVRIIEAPRVGLIGRIGTILAPALTVDGVNIIQLTQPKEIVSLFSYRLELVEEEAINM